MSEQSHIRQQRGSLPGWLRLALIALAVGLWVHMSGACAPTTPTGDGSTKEQGSSSEQGTEQDAASSDVATQDTTADAPPADRAPPSDDPTPDATPDTTPDSAPDATSDQGSPDQGNPDSPKSCSHDCDCAADKKVCENGACSGAERASTCVSCSADCTAGDPCLKDDGSVGTCGGAIACKSDCDCRAKGMNCEGGTCAMTDRINACPACDGSNCPNGDPCYNKDGSIGTCSGPTACKSDCDCVKAGLNCESGKCSPTRRVNTCPACGSVNCPKGDPCYNPDKSVGICSASTTCKNDCECVKLNMNCDGGRCSPSKRINLCPACGSANCPSGDPCYNKDKSVGTCSAIGTPCKNDCECVPHGLNCDSGKCSATRRVNLCPMCGGSNCPKGDPCYDSTNKRIGVCGSTLPSCSDKSCKPNTQCIDSNGNTAYCCCTIAGCGSGQLCCVTSGVNPGPGRCANSCLTVKQCPPPPP